MIFTRKQFIDKIAPQAVEVMKETDLSAALSIAQGCLESRNGNSGLTQKANNLFGIKGKGDAGSITMRTAEQRKDGSVYYVDAPFAKYSSWRASIDGRTRLLLNGVSWNRNLYKPVLGKRGRDAAYAIQAAGYATDIAYAKLLIGIMDTYDLYRFDAVGPQEPSKPIVVPPQKEPAVNIIEGIFSLGNKRVSEAYIIDGVSYVPLRELGDYIGFGYGWDNKRKVATINGRDVQVFQLYEGRVFVRLRTIAEAYGKKVLWDQATSTVGLA